jgi:hypothetical protein
MHRLKFEQELENIELVNFSKTTLREKNLRRILNELPFFYDQVK